MLWQLMLLSGSVKGIKKILLGTETLIYSPWLVVEVCIVPAVCWLELHPSKTPSLRKRCGGWENLLWFLWTLILLFLSPLQ